MKNFMIMTQSRLAKGVTRPSRYRKKPPMMNSQRLAVVKNVPTSTKLRATEEGHQGRGIQEHREEDLQGGEVSDGEHLCRGLIALGAVLVAISRAAAAAWSLLEHSRAAGHLSCSVAVTEQRPDRHRPSRGLQLLRQARDEDRVPAGLSESIVQSQAASRTRPCRSPALPHTQGPCPHRHQPA